MKKFELKNKSIFETHDQTLEKVIIYYGEISKFLKDFEYGPLAIALIHCLAKISSACQDNQETLDAIIDRLKIAHKNYRDKI